jgi:hypothetical protein
VEDRGAGLAAEEERADQASHDDKHSGR